MRVTTYSQPILLPHIVIDRRSSNQHITTVREGSIEVCWKGAIWKERIQLPLHLNVVEVCRGLCHLKADDLKVMNDVSRAGTWAEIIERLILQHVLEDLRYLLIAVEVWNLRRVGSIGGVSV